MDRQRRPKYCSADRVLLRGAVVGTRGAQDPSTARGASVASSNTTHRQASITGTDPSMPLRLTRRASDPSGGALVVRRRMMATVDVAKV